MSYTFDGANKLCILGLGVSTLDTKEMYSRWKDWAAEGDNIKHLPFLDVIGGNPTVGSNSIASYFFVLNGWKIRPSESNHTLTVDGILNADDGSDPFANTIGSWRVRIVQIIPMQAETITVTGGGGSSYTPSQIAAAVRTELSPELGHVMALQNGEGLSSVQATMLLEIYRLYGLDPTIPLVVSNTARMAGTINQNINSNSNATIITRV